MALTTRLNQVLDRTAGQGIGLSNYESLVADINYLVVPGADVASAATLSIDHKFHGVTGTTTITNIVDGLNAVEGQTVELWIKNGPLTIQNNGSGAGGNIRTASGSDRKCYGGEIVTFRFDGTNWREVNPASGDRIAYGKNTGAVSTSGTTFATGADILASPLSFTADGVRDYILKVFGPRWYNASAAANSIVEANLDGADAGRIGLFTSATAGAATPLSAAALLVAPAAGAHTINARLLVGGGTATIQGGAGGLVTELPISVTLEVA